MKLYVIFSDVLYKTAGLLYRWENPLNILIFSLVSLNWVIHLRLVVLAFLDPCILKYAKTSLVYHTAGRPFELQENTFSRPCTYICDPKFNNISNSVSLLSMQPLWKDNCHSSIQEQRYTLPWRLNPFSICRFSVAAMDVFRSISNLVWTSVFPQPPVPFLFLSCILTSHRSFGILKISALQTLLPVTSICLTFFCTLWIFPMQCTQKLKLLLFYKIRIYLMPKCKIHFISTHHTLVCLCTDS